MSATKSNLGFVPNMLRIYISLFLLVAVVFIRGSAEQTPKGILILNSYPTEAQVYVDDKSVGTTGPQGRLKLSLKPGKHLVRLSLSGYMDWKHSFSLMSGQQMSRIVVLTAAQTQSPKAASDSHTTSVASIRPSVPDIQSWIITHMGMQVVTTFRDPDNSYTVTYSDIRPTFNDCSVTVREVDQSHDDYTSLGQDHHVNYNGSHTWTTDLSNIQPGKLEVRITNGTANANVTSTQAAYLFLPFVKPVSTYTTSQAPTLGGYVKDQEPTTREDNGQFITFADADLATRQLNAWRDLVMACGGKDVSDKLY